MHRHRATIANTLLGLFLTACASVSAATPNYIIYEDDYDSDSDGPMALCMLLELEAAGECQIIACGTSELHNDATSAMAATLHYFDRSDVPLGSFRSDLRPIDTPSQLSDDSIYDTEIAADEFNYGHTRRDRNEYPDAIEVYVQALNALPAGAKAKLIIAGAQNNLRDLLEKYPDVVRDRISELHFMGGEFYPENGEADETVWDRDSNLWSARYDTKYVAENWPSEIPVYIAGVHVGRLTKSCQPETRAQLSDIHPAKRIFLMSRWGWNGGHDSYDQISVVSAVRGFTNLNGVDFTLQRGTLQVNADGYHRFISSPDGPHTRIRRDQDSTTAQKLADYIDGILLMRGGEADEGLVRDEFVAGHKTDETLQSKRGWTKAGAADSNTLIDSSGFHECQYVQFNGNTATLPYNVQVRDVARKDVRVRAYVRVIENGGHIGVCVRSDASVNARGLNLRLQPGTAGLRLFDNGSELAQTRTVGSATPFALNTWYTIELRVTDVSLVGRLLDNDDGVTVVEQVEATLDSAADRTWAGLVARDLGEHAGWFQAGDADATSP